MLTGCWDNFNEMEEKLSYPELNLMVKALRDREEREFRVLAAVNGIELNKNDKNEEFERVKRNAEARRRGVTEEQVELEELGFKMIEE